MKSSSMTKVHLIGIVFGFTFCIIGLATSEWMYVEIDDVRIENEGLWEDRVGKFKVTDGPAWFNAVRGLVIAATCLLVISAILTLVSLGRLTASAKKILVTFSTSLCFIIGVCLIVAVIIYGVEMNKGDVTLGYSFGLIILAAILTFIAAFVGIIAIRNTEWHTQDWSPGHLVD